MAAHKLEALLEGKPDRIQNKLRKAFNEAGIDDNDPIWVLVEIFDAYGDEISSNADISENSTSEIKKIRQSIQNDLKKNITSHFKLIREVSFTEYAGLLDTHATKLEESITKKYNRMGNSVIRAIDSSYIDAESKINKRIDDLVDSAVRSRVHPLARLVSGIFGVSFLLISMSVFAGIFLVVGAQAGMGNVEFLSDLFNFKVIATGGD
jgi:hypothetical protein